MGVNICSSFENVQFINLKKDIVIPPAKEEFCPNTSKFDRIKSYCPSYLICRSLRNLLSFYFSYEITKNLFPCQMSTSFCSRKSFDLKIIMKLENEYVFSSLAL